jgi:hypothetical protein
MRWSRVTGTYWKRPFNCRFEFAVHASFGNRHTKVGPANGLPFSSEGDAELISQPYPISLRRPVNLQARRTFPATR